MRRIKAAALAVLFACAASAPAAVTVRDVRLIDYRIERTRAFVTAKGQSDSCYGIFVLITADDGKGGTVAGLGDALPRGLVTDETLADAWAGAGAMAAALKGRQLDGRDLVTDAKAAAAWVADLDAIAAGQKLTGRNPPPADKQLRATLCGFDEAILDVVARAHGVPVFDVLGGAKRDTVTISAMTYNADAGADELAERAEAGSAYGAMRLKIGLGDDADVKKIAAVAAEIVKKGQPTQIWVDVNQAWKTADHSLEALGRVRDALTQAGFKNEFICEQPTDEKDLAALAAVTKQVRQWNENSPFKIVVMADEAVWTLADVKKMVATDAADALNIKIQKCGGLLAGKAIADYLSSASPATRVYVGGVVATDVTSWANLQLCLALPRLDWATSPIPRRAYPVNAAATPMRYKTGKTLAKPTTAGLGTDLALDKLERYIRRDTNRTDHRAGTRPAD